MRQSNVSTPATSQPILRLRQLDATAESVFLALFCHPQVMRYIQPAFNLTEARQRFTTLLASLHPRKTAAFNAEYFLVEHSNNEAIGIAMLIPGNEPAEAELGRMLLPAWQGQGLGSLLSQLLIAKAAEHPQLHYLTKRIHSNNLAALNSATQQGFRPIAQLPDGFIRLRLQLKTAACKNKTP